MYVAVFYIHLFKDGLMMFTILATDLNLMSVRLEYIRLLYVSCGLYIASGAINVAKHKRLCLLLGVK